MAFDAHANLAVSTVTTPPSPAASGTSLIVAAGHGSRFPTPPFNATVWPANEMPNPATAEIVRVTARSTDTFTITRSQEGTSARTIVAGDLITASITLKTLTDIEAGTNFPFVRATGTGRFEGAGPPPGSIGFGVELKVSSDQGSVTTYNRSTSQYGTLNVQGAPITFLSGTGALGTMFTSGGFGWGLSATDPGANNLMIMGTLRVNGGALVFGADSPITRATADGADTGTQYLAGGGSVLSTRGACVAVAGNEAPLTGSISLSAGNVAGASIQFLTGADAVRGRVHFSGGWQVGSSGTDPGSGNLLIGNQGLAAGNTFTHAAPGLVSIGGPGAATQAALIFYNTNGAVGSVTTTASGTAYNTTSDARLKRDRGVHHDPDVLRRTVVHAFDWIADDRPGRGVFAQEAITVAPFAVMEGTDERDDAGRLVKPWSVDYSKYVPDLIVGWQTHDATIAAILARVAALEKFIGTRGAA